MLNVAVLGSNSFIGKHLVTALALNPKLKVTAFARHLTKPADEKIRFVEGDFESRTDMETVLENQDVVYHIISQTIPSSTWNDPLTEVEKNLVPSLNFIETAAKFRIKKICFASSGGSVYGLQTHRLDENTMTRPYSPYGIIKKTIESFLEYARVKYDINYDIYRISNVYGEGQNIGKGLGFINTVLECLVSNQPVTVYGDGKNIRDYIYVKDVARLLCLDLEARINQSDVYNVSAGQSFSINELLFLIKKVVRMDFEVHYVENRLSDNSQVFLDNAKILKLGGIDSITGIEEGIEKTFNYLKTQMSAKTTANKYL